jgi:hypothetical protein
MKTIAEKNKVETELRYAPSNIWQGRDKNRKRIRTTIWIALVAVCIVAGWLAGGIGKEIIAVADIKHLLTAFLALRWLFVKRASTLRTLILIITAQIIL